MRKGIQNSIEEAPGYVPHIEKEIKEQERQQQYTMHSAVEQAAGPYLVEGSEIAEGVVSADKDKEEDPSKYLHLAQEKEGE